MKNTPKNLKKLKTIAWYNAAARKLKLDNPEKIAKKMGDRSGLDDARAWWKYRSGSIGVSQPKRNLLEKKLNGTNEVYESGPDGSGLWLALNPDTPSLERYNQIQSLCDKWKRKKKIPKEVQQWLDYWPPKHRTIQEIIKEVPTVLANLAEYYPLHALAIAYHIWYTITAGLLSVMLTTDYLPAAQIVLAPFLKAEKALLRYGITKTLLLEVADPLGKAGKL